MDLHDTDPSGSTLTRVDLIGARFEQVDLQDAFLRNVHLTGARLRGAWLERVDIEYSFLETLRHLVFCTDAWLRRVVLGEPTPYWVAGVPHDEMDDDTPVPVDLAADPGLDEVLAARVERVAAVDAALTDERLDGTTTATGEGYPAAGEHAVRRCVMAVVREELADRLFAERDLAVLEAGPAR